MIRYLKMYISSLIILFFLLSCSASDKVSTNYIDPSVSSEDITFEKVVNLALLQNRDDRKLVENEISRRMVNRMGVSAYKILDDEDLKDVDVIKKKLTERGFDGVLLIRIVGNEERKSYVPGHYTSTSSYFSNYYNYSYGYIFDPGARTVYDRVVSIEINIYSLKSEKLIWSGESTTFNPQDLKYSVAKLMKSLAERLRDEGLLETNEP